MRLKRFFAGILAAFLFVLPITAQAQADKEGAAQAIIDACTYGTEANLAEYQLSTHAAEDLFHTLYNEGRLPWYAEQGYSSRYNMDTNMILSLEPQLMDPAQYDRTLYEQRVAEALAACALPGMSQVQLALSVHDWLIANSAYDQTLEKNTGYDLLVNGTAVCAGYAAIYQDLMLRLGIPCLMVTSEAMEHGWNLVQLDGQWYHVDLTWDDPTPDSYGQVMHTYFLLTDAEISAGDNPHYSWDVTIPCTDTRFSDAFWKNTLGQICYADSSTAYLIRHKDWNNYIYARDEATGSEKLLYTEKQNYVNLGEGRYCYYHGSLSLWNGRLYYNRQDKLVSMDLNGKDVRTEYTHDTGSNHSYIYACYITKDTAYISFADHGDNRSTATVSLTASGYHVHNYTLSVTDPTCTTPGYTTSTCDCGLTAQSLPTAALGHNYEETEGKEANIFSDGWSTQTCLNCGDTFTEEYPQLDFGEWFKENRSTLLLLVLMVFAFSKLLKKKKK